MPRARSPLGGFFEVMPVAPACVCTSTETLSRSSRLAASDGVADAAGASRSSWLAASDGMADAAGASLRELAQAPSVAPAEANSAFHIQARRVRAWPQQVMGSLPMRRR